MMDATIEPWDDQYRVMELRPDCDREMDVFYGTAEQVIEWVRPQCEEVFVRYEDKSTAKLLTFDLCPDDLILDV